MNEEIIKYPRTQHLQGSSLQSGDEDLSQVPYSDLAGKHIIVEEKLDGANTGVSFNENLDLRLQSRGHYLYGGPNEGEFNQLKGWARAHETALMERLENRYIMYGEYMTSKHTVFYDALPHIFLEFDVYDRTTGEFLSTQMRKNLLHGLPVLSVPVIYDGIAPKTIKELLLHIRFSLAKTKQWKQNFERHANKIDYPLDRAWKETDPSNMSEGLYIKVETAEKVVQRLKWVRADFLQTIKESESHWKDRMRFTNLLRPGTDIFAPRLTTSWANNIIDDVLLSREAFKEKVFARTKGLCAFCLCPAVDAHHIFDRKLYPDGGYYLTNGVAVCETHHRLCEDNSILPAEVYERIGVLPRALPLGVTSAWQFDKWGEPL